jgi:hypothetical protein
MRRPLGAITVVLAATLVLVAITSGRTSNPPASRTVPPNVTTLGVPR